MAGVWATGSSVSHDNPAFGVPGHSAGSDAPSAVLIDSKDAIDGGGGGEPGGRSGSVSSVMSAEAGAGAGGGRKRTVSTLRSVVARMRSAGMIPAGSGAMAPPEPGARFAAAARGALEAHKKARRESRGVPLLQVRGGGRVAMRTLVHVGTCTSECAGAPLLQARMAACSRACGGLAHVPNARARCRRSRCTGWCWARRGTRRRRGWRRRRRRSGSTSRRASCEVRVSVCVGAGARRPGHPPSPLPQTRSRRDSSAWTTRLRRGLTRWFLV